MQTDFTLEPGATPLEIARKRKLAEALMREATDTSPVRHWTQGAARLAQALRGVQEDWSADSEQRKYDDYGKKLGGELDGMPAAASGLASALAEPSAAKTPAFVASNGAMAPADLMPHFEAASKATGIPAALLMAQAKQESGFNPNAIGKAGEVGLTQILPSTARQPGFGVQPTEPNELRDPARNIAFGAQYLAARGKAAGVQDWNDPQQAARGLKAYNGGGDPNYVANVTRNLTGGAGQQTLAGGDNLGQTGPSPQRLMAIMSDRNAPPQIRERAKLMYMEAQKNTGPEAELRRLQIQKVQKELGQPAPDNRPSGIREYEYAKSQGFGGSFEEFKTKIARSGASNVNVNGGGSDKQVFDFMEKNATAAQSAVQGLQSIQEAKKAIQGGAILGAGADAILGLKKVAAVFGADATSIQNTETFRSAIAPQIAAMMKATVGSTQISNADREFAAQAAGGSITLDKGTITRLLDVMERGNRALIDNHRKRLDTVYPDGGQYGRERALFGLPDIPPAPPSPAQPPTRDEIEAEIRRRRSAPTL